MARDVHKSEHCHSHCAGEDLGKLVRKMREAIAAAGEDEKAVDDSTLVRFLRARSMSIPKASKMFLDDVKWRREYLGPSGIEPRGIEPELRSRKSFIVARSGQRPWVFLFIRHHDATTRDLKQFQGLVVYVIEKALERLPPREEMFGVVVDLGDTRRRNLDMQAMLVIFDVLQAHYPERLHALIAIHVPYIFWGIWKIVQPLVDKRTREKIKFVEDAEVSTVLEGAVPHCMLPKELGGEADLVGHWEQFVEGGEGTHEQDQHASAGECVCAQPVAAKEGL